MPKSLLYHNPKCSKSRQALDIISKNNLKFTIVLYLQNKLTKSMLHEILNLSGLEARDLIRTNEPEYKENNLNDANLTQDALLDLILKYPNLLQRPIFIHNGKAIIARPPGDVLKLI